MPECALLVFINAKKCVWRVEQELCREERYNRDHCKWRNGKTRDESKIRFFVSQ